MGVDKISVCNQALGQLPCSAIDSFEENSTAAEWCARLYSPTLRYLLDRHDWKFPRKREALAQVTNDREGEWAFAYALPSTCVSELRLLPPDTSLWSEVPLLDGQALAPWSVSVLTSPPSWRYLIFGGKIYSNVEAALLEFIEGAPSESGFRPLFENALVWELASRLAMPVKQSRERQGDLIKLAEMALDRAIADELNRDSSDATWGGEISELEIARGGGLLGGAPFGLVG